MVPTLGVSAGKPGGEQVSGATGVVSPQTRPLIDTAFVPVQTLHMPV